MINEKQALKYCGEDISLIENYAEAAADCSQTWDIHHRLEIMPWGRYSKKDLKKNGLYYGVPAAQLVFMKRKDHLRLHFKGQALSDECKRRMSETRKGRPRSEETKRRISEARKGQRLSDETKRKLSESHKGKVPSEETKRKMSESQKCRKIPDEVIKKRLETYRRNHPPK